tara:strand:- start:911 stop:1171 length:261 start_codon:yes stop_codon:yes gene_type:complete
MDAYLEKHRPTVKGLLQWAMSRQAVTDQDLDHWLSLNTELTGLDRDKLVYLLHVDGALTPHHRETGRCWCKRIHNSRLSFHIPAQD